MGPVHDTCSYVLLDGRLTSLKGTEKTVHGMPDSDISPVSVERKNVSDSWPESGLASGGLQRGMTKQFM